MNSDPKNNRFTGNNETRFLSSGKKFRVNHLNLTSRLLIGLLFCIAVMFYSSGCVDFADPSPETPNIPITLEIKNASNQSLNIWIEMDCLWEVKSPANLMAPGASRMIKDKTVFPDAQNEIVIWGFLDGQTLYSGFSVMTDKYNKLTNVHIYLTITYDGANFNCVETYTSDN